jgi:hypothetical protein
MSAKYKVFGEHIRPVGLQDGEIVHQAAMDRRGYYDGTIQRPEPWAERKYAPVNLEKFVKEKAPTKFAETRRVLRGTPCPIVPTTGVHSR